MTRAEARRVLYRRQGAMCLYCGWRLPLSDLTLHQDGGLILLCPPCKVEADISRIASLV